MKTLILFVFSPFFLLSTMAMAQSADVTVSLSPAGSFVGKTSEVKGFAIQKGNMVTASNIVVNLKSLKTGIDLRDEHTRKHLDVNKFPEAVLISAKGQNGKGIGLIQIRGVQKQVSGTYTINGSTVDANFLIKFSDFKITGIKYMGIGVKDEGKIHVIIPIKKS